MLLLCIWRGSEGSSTSSPRVEPPWPIPIDFGPSVIGMLSAIWLMALMVTVVACCACRITSFDASFRRVHGFWDSGVSGGRTLSVL